MTTLKALLCKETIDYELNSPTVTEVGELLKKLGLILIENNCITNLNHGTEESWQNTLQVYEKYNKGDMQFVWPFVFPQKIHFKWKTFFSANIGESHYCQKCFCYCIGGDKSGYKRNKPGVLPSESIHVTLQFMNRKDVYCICCKLPLVILL